MTTLAEVRLWGRTIGAVSIADGDDVASFQYEPNFAKSGVEISPLVMPLATRVYRFPELPRASFHGLPGLLADSIPDKFGNALIDTWLASEGRSPASFNAVERLCYTGARGIGALEFYPTKGFQRISGKRIAVDALVDLASAVLSRREDLAASFADDSERMEALTDILRVGTSAGGARAKAVIAWNPQTNEVRSGQVRAPAGFEYWLLKFDGVRGNRDKELDDPKGFGAIEYAYSKMAVDAGIKMSECRLLEENGRRHFMTRRFDRLPNGEKLHMQSLGALAHYDFNNAGAYSYEQAMEACRRLELPTVSVEEILRRMIFNIVARNQDDHVKNIAFLMDKRGDWQLSPAFDITYSFNPSGLWTSSHQMTLAGKRDGFTIADFRDAARNAGLKRGRAEAILAEITTIVRRWPEYADETSVTPAWRDQIASTLRLEFPSK